MTKYNARDSIIKEISSKESKQFLINNHSHSWTAAIKHYGLFVNNELLSVITVRRYRGMDFNYEIARFASKKDCYIRGGLSKLMKRICSEFGGEIGFAIFPAEFDGHSMLVSGFEFVKQVKSQVIGNEFVDYYRWSKPNTSLSIGYVYKNTYKSGKYYYGKHEWIGTGMDPNYHGSGDDTNEILIKEEIIELAYSKSQLSYRENWWIKKHLGPNCLNKPASLKFVNDGTKDYTFNDGWESKETKEKRRKIFLGNTWTKGKKIHSDEFKQALSERNKNNKWGSLISESSRLAKKELLTNYNKNRAGKWHQTEEGKSNISKAQIGKHWWHDPVTMKSCFSFECPSGFVAGRK